MPSSDIDWGSCPATETFPGRLALDLLMGLVCAVLGGLIVNWTFGIVFALGLVPGWSAARGAAKLWPPQQSAFLRRVVGCHAGSRRLRSMLHHHSQRGGALVTVVRTDPCCSGWNSVCRTHHQSARP